MTDKRDAPPTIAEVYACVTGNGDLAPNAQQFLGAAAWTSGSPYEFNAPAAVRRLRNSWDTGRPRKKVARPVSALRASGMARDQAKRLHNRELVGFAVAHHREKEGLKRRIPEYAQVLEAMVVHAASEGIEEPGPKALAVLDRWLDDEQQTPRDIDEARLWSYLRDCLNRAKAALRQGVAGHTKHEFEQD